MAFENSAEIQALIDKTIQQYQTGGAFEKKELGNLGRKRELAMATAFQGQVSRGLAGTSVPQANLGQFEENVGVPARTAIESSRVSALTSALTEKSNYLAREQAQKEQAQIQKEQAQVAAKSVVPGSRSRSSKTYTTNRAFGGAMGGYARW